MWIVNREIDSNKKVCEWQQPGDIMHFVYEGLVPHGVEGLGLGGGAVQVVLVGVDGDVRVYRLVVCNTTSIYIYYQHPFW